MKKKIFILILLGGLVALLITCKYNLRGKESRNTSLCQTNVTYDTNTWNEFLLTHKVENANNVEAHIKNQFDLEVYLSKTGNDLSGDMIWLENTENITFPTGIYTFTKRTDFYLIEAMGDIDFHYANFVIGNGGSINSTVLGDQHNRFYKNLTVYGNSLSEIGNTGNGTYSDLTNLTRLGSGYYLQAIKSSNMNFSNLEFNMALSPGSHLFDIMGCSNYNFSNITSRGALENWNNEELLSLYNKNPHTIYAEMIQIDITGIKSPGVTTHLSQEFQNNYFKEDLIGDNISTKNTSLFNIRTTSYHGNTGEGLLTNTDIIVDKPYSATIGAHGMGNDAYNGISIKNIELENTIHLPEINDSRLAPIHFPILSEGTNKEINTQKLSGEDLTNIIKNDLVWQNTNINTNNLKLINCANEFIEPANQKTPNSLYLNFYNTNPQGVTKTILIDEDNKVLKTYEGYYPEEVLHDGYTYLSTEYQGGVLKRKYTKPHQAEIEININYDEDGNKLLRTNGYLLKDKKIETETEEKLINGDIIKVIHNKNIYKKNTSLLVNVPDTASLNNLLSVFISCIILLMIALIISIYQNRLTTNN